MEYSILMPVYRAEQYLAAAIESALAQSFGDFELVMVEDGSPDASAAVMDDYAARFPEKIRAIHCPHRGTIATRREAIAAARGEFCLFLDSDDLLAPDALETVHRAREKHPELDIFLYEYTFFYDDARADVVRPALFPDGTVMTGEEAKRPVYEYLIRGNLLDSLCIKAIRTKLLKSDPTDYAPYAANPFGEDVLHCLWPVSEAGTIVTTEKSLYRYRMHEGSVMHEFSASNLDRRFNELKFRFFEPFMARWGLNDADHRLLLKASSYKGLADGVLYFIEEGAAKKDIRDYVSRFVDAHPELKSIAKSSLLPVKLRVTLSLLARKKPYLIEAILKLYRKIK